MTGINLLGLSIWEARYLGEVLGRPFSESLPPLDDRGLRADADETR